MPGISLVASESRRIAVNTVVNTLFDTVDEATSMVDGQKIVGLLDRLDPQFRGYRTSLPVPMRRMLSRHLSVGPIEGDEAVLDQRDEADFGGIRVSRDFYAEGRSVGDEFIVNNEARPTRLAASRYLASGVVEFGPPETDYCKAHTFTFSPANAIVVMRAARNKETHSYQYLTGSGNFSFEAGIELLLGDQNMEERADGLLSTFSSLMAVMLDRERSDLQ